MHNALNSRVLLLGDRRQHKSVPRGDVLKLLEDKAGLPVAEVADIRRQTGEYKSAVQLASQGHVAEAFDRLDKLGWVKEGGLVDDYMAAMKANKSVLVVSPTRAQGEAVTQQIRDRLRQEGVLKGEEKEFTRLVPLHRTEAERTREDSYEDGEVAQVMRSGRGFKAGRRITIDRGNVSDVAGAGAQVGVYRPETVRLAAGDLVRITGNGKTLDGKHRLNNGATYSVAGFDRDGNIKLGNGWTVGREFGHVAPGYVVTSHASQGRTVDRVLVAQDSQSFPASGKEQFYVSISRGKHQATIYTDDRKALKEAINRDDTRFLATDLVREKKRHVKKRLKKFVAFLRRVGKVRSLTKGRAHEAEFGKVDHGFQR